MQYFDVEDKAWKPLASLASATEGLKFWSECLWAETVGRKLFVVGREKTYIGPQISCYDMELKVWVWEKHDLPCLVDKLCIVAEYMYAICLVSTTLCSNSFQRYSFVERRWQDIAKVNFAGDPDYGDHFYFTSGITAFHSKVYVLYGHRSRSNSSWCTHKAVLHCFDPVRNVWERKASTCQPHFGSSLFVVNSKLYVAGGKVSHDDIPMPPPWGGPRGGSALVEVYDEENNKWSVVEQTHIPAKNFGAVEIEGRVYFLINKFPVDSGIRIPPGEVYPVNLDEWENLRKIDRKAVLCYAPGGPF